MGLGLRPAHYPELAAGVPPGIGYFEVIVENVLAAPELPRRRFEAVAARRPVVAHGVSLNLLGADPLDEPHLDALAAFVREHGVPWVSDHLCWSRTGAAHHHDLLPAPYHPDLVDYVAERIRYVQARLGVPFAVENLSSYLTWTRDSLPEWAFVRAVVARAECHLLLDVNNVYVSSRNHGFDPRDPLDAVDWDRVIEVHLAGHDTLPDGRRHDTHDRPVDEAVWALYREAWRRGGPFPTLLEWDDRIPPLAVAVAELEKARGARGGARRVAGARAAAAGQAGEGAPVAAGAHGVGAAERPAGADGGAGGTGTAVAGGAAPEVTAAPREGAGAAAWAPREGVASGRVGAADSPRLAPPAWLIALQAEFGAVLRTPLDPSTGTFRPRAEAYPAALVAAIGSGAGAGFHVERAPSGGRAETGADAHPGADARPSARPCTGAEVRSGAAPTGAVLPAADAHTGADARARLAIYHRQYWMRIFHAFQHGFPVLTRALGPWWLNQLVAIHVGARAPAHADLDRAGDGFAEAVEAAARLLEASERPEPKRADPDRLRPQRADPDRGAPDPWLPLLRRAGAPAACVAEAAALDRADRACFTASWAPPWRPTPEEAHALGGLRLRAAPSLQLVRVDLDFSGARPVPRPPGFAVFARTEGGVARALVPLAFGRLLEEARARAFGEALAVVGAEGHADALAAHLPVWIGQAVRGGWWVGAEERGVWDEAREKPP